jgi:allantoin racemase
VCASNAALSEDRADVLVLGCGTLSFRSTELQDRLGVPVINPLQAALRTAEMFVAMGISHSMRSHPWPPKGLLTSDLLNV